MRISVVAVLSLAILSCVHNPLRAQGYTQPTAVYPGGVVTNEQLKIQSNGVQTFLTAPVTLSSTLWSVNGCTGMPAGPFFGTIDQRYSVPNKIARIFVGH